MMRTSAGRTRSAGRLSISPQMIAMVERLVARGHAYEAGGNVYYDTATFPAYPDFARLQMDAPGSDRTGRRRRAQAQPGGFRALVRPVEISQPDHEVGLALGRRLSRLAHRMFGHGERISRRDHRPALRRHRPCAGPPHQRDRPVRGLFRPPLGRYIWLHGEFLVVDDAKMAKSSGRFPASRPAGRGRLRPDGLPLPAADRPLPGAAQASASRRWTARASL